MSKANEDKLSDLHGAVAEVLTEQVKHKACEKSFDDDGNEVEVGEPQFVASSATLAVAVKFLKDNKITCDVDQNENMSKLEELLSNKKKRSQLGDPTTAAKGLDNNH